MLARMFSARLIWQELVSNPVNSARLSQYHTFSHARYMSTYPNFLARRSRVASGGMLGNVGLSAFILNPLLT